MKFSVHPFLASLLIGHGIAQSLDRVDLQESLQQEPQAKKPNVVFILTDDQDLHLDSLAYMPFVKKHLADQGTSFQRHYCTVALCCPSRVNLWTGKAAHNTNVTDVNPPYGGYPKFVSQGHNEAWLPLWLQEAGYNTYYTGKLFNSHSISYYDDPFPSGFNGSDFLLDPHTYEYLNAYFQRNQDPPVGYQGEYSTDVLARKAYGFLQDALAETRPFFLTIAPIAPHSNLQFEESSTPGSVNVQSLKNSPPVSAERHQHLFKDAIVPRHAGFNPDEPSGVSWISTLPKQNRTVVDANDHFYRQRLRALQAVDEIVDEVVQRLDKAGVLDNTYIFYSSDNGYHIGQHRLHPGKECGFEEDINVPLIVRGPGIPQNQTSDMVTSHTDLAPTFLSLVGGQLRPDFDGQPIPLHSLDDSSKLHTRSEHVGIEFWGFGLSEGQYSNEFYWNNTYKGLRLIGTDYNLYYSVWCSGEHELYDLNRDPYEMDNLYRLDHDAEFSFSITRITTSASQSDQRSPPAENDRGGKTTSKDKPTKLSHLIPRLDSLIMVLKTCKARSCTHPWDILHPSQNVHDLHDALDSKYDEFYEERQQRVRFERCEKGYILEAEGPNGVRAYGIEEVGIRGGRRWSDLV